MKIFDAHMHVGGYLPPNPEKLIQDMEKAGVVGGCIMSIDPADPNFSYEQRMENLFSWVKGYEDRLFPVAWMHPDEEKIEEKILDAIARGVVAAAKATGLTIPLVVRLEGTNAAIGKEILAASGMDIIAASDMADGARKAVAAAQAQTKKGERAQ